MAGSQKFQKERLKKFSVGISGPSTVPRCFFPTFYIGTTTGTGRNHALEKSSHFLRNPAAINLCAVRGLVDFSEEALPSPS
jgi:hypothetical protein